MTYKHFFVLFCFLFFFSYKHFKQPKILLSSLASIHIHKDFFKRSVRGISDNFNFYLLLCIFQILRMNNVLLL